MHDTCRRFVGGEPCFGGWVVVPGGHSPGLYCRLASLRLSTTAVAIKLVLATAHRSLDYVQNSSKDEQHLQ